MGASHVPVDGDLYGPPGRAGPGSLGSALSVCPGRPGLQLRRHRVIVISDVNKSEILLMHFLRIAALLPSASPISFQGLPGLAGPKGSTGRPGLWGKKVHTIFLMDFRC